MSDPSEEEAPEAEPIAEAPLDDDEPAPLPLEPLYPLLVAGASAGAFYWGFRSTPFEPHSPAVPIGGAYALLGLLAVARLWRRDELSTLRPRSGDLTFGALVAALLYGLAFATHVLVTAPGTGRSGWIMQLYLHLGDSFGPSRHLVAAGIAVVALLEELVWRGFVTPILEQRFGIGRGNSLNVALYGAAHLPSLWLLADPVAGLNPLLVVAALGCGAVWSYLRWRLDRLPPVLFSHALFTWAIVEFPLWR